MLVTNGFLKINETSLKTQALKEAPFNSSTFPAALKAAEESLARPKTNTTTYPVPTPVISTYSGVQAGNRTTRAGAPEKVGIFSETAYLPDIDGYFYPLGSDTDGRLLADIGDTPSKPISSSNKFPNLQGEFEPEEDLICIDKPSYFYGEGAFPNKSTLHNLLSISEIKAAWNVNATVSPLEKNIVSAPDGLSISATRINVDTKGNYVVVPEESGYYSFSFYARISGRNYYSNNIRYLRISISPSVANSYTIAPVNGLHPSDDYLFNLKFEWKRYAGVFYLEANQEYTITLNWFVRDNTTGNIDNYRAADLRICGVFFEKAITPSLYDYQYINKPIPEITTCYPLVLDMEDLPIFSGGADNWTVAYRRKIFDNPVSGAIHYDSLGDVYWGYQGNSVIASNFNSEEALIVDVASFYNTWEVVVLQHKSGSGIINVFVDATDTNLSYSFQINIDGLDLTHYLQGQRYNLMLGSKEDTLEEISSCIYRDLIVIADDSDEIIQKLRKSLLRIAEGEVDIVTSTTSTTVADATIVADADFIEKSNLEY